MLPPEVTYFLKKFKNTAFVYPWKYFTKRMYEETARSIIDNSPMLYVEIPFATVANYIQGEEARREFWKAFFEHISTQKRVCDVFGFLHNDIGIALMFLDISLNFNDVDIGFNRLCDKIFAKTLVNVQEWDGVTSVLYPPKEFFQNNSTPSDR